MTLGDVKSRQLILEQEAAAEMEESQDPEDHKKIQADCQRQINALWEEYREQQTSQVHP